MPAVIPGRSVEEVFAELDPAGQGQLLLYAEALLAAPMISCKFCRLPIRVVSVPRGAFCSVKCSREESRDRSLRSTRATIKAETSLGVCGFCSRRVAVVDGRGMLARHKAKGRSAWCSGGG